MDARAMDGAGHTAAAPTKQGHGSSLSFLPSLIGCSGLSYLYLAGLPGYGWWWAGLGDGR